jgi:hypothetical protein
LRPLQVLEGLWLHCSSATQAPSPLQLALEVFRHVP